MAVPAALAAVARVLATKGVTEAVKKFGKKAVDEARKHAKDMVTKPNKGQQQIEKATKGQRAYRGGQRKSAAVGAAAAYGAGQMGGNSDSSKPKAKPAPKAKAKAKDSRANPSDYPTYRKESKSAVSFREAQRKAKSNGQKTFTWEGRRYNTKEK